MILIAESGSTKCDAVILTPVGKEVLRFSMMGFNPFFHTSEFIEKELNNIPEIQEYGERILELFFYGAGCSSQQNKNIVQAGFAPHFKNATITIDHDLTACAYATYTGRPGLSCILGTGSNSIYFDGKTIQQEVPSLGYAIGDEGSAGYIGRRLVAAYFYKQLPREAAEDFQKTFQPDKDYILDRMYRKPNPNVFLASFAPFAHRYKKHPYFYTMLFSGFVAFAKNMILCYPKANELPISYVGSVAHFYRDILEDVHSHLGLLPPAQTIQKPLDGLINYHIKKPHLK